MTTKYNRHTTRTFAIRKQMVADDMQTVRRVADETKDHQRQCRARNHRKHTGRRCP